MRPVSGAGRVKFKELVYLLGLRPRPRRYGFELRQFELPALGPVQFAHWRHPKALAKPVTPAMLDALRRYLGPGDVAVDIGAHTGDTSLPLALVVGPTGCVVAVEPNPYVFPVLAATAKLNPHLTRILPLPFAAAPRDEVLEFEYSDAGFCNGGRHEGISRWRHGHAFRLQVQGRNLVTYLEREYPDLPPHLRWIKTDTEGFDQAVLESLLPWLRRYRPYLRAEVYEHLPEARRRVFYRFLTALGYRVHRYSGDTDICGEALSEADMLRFRHFDVFCLPGDGGDSPSV